MPGLWGSFYPRRWSDEDHDSSLPLGAILLVLGLILAGCDGSPTTRIPGASPLSSSGSSSCLDSWRMAFSRSTVVTLSSPFGPSSDKAGSKRIMHFVGLLWPLLTSRSAGRPNSAMPASPFQASGETSPGKNDDLPRTIAGSTPLPLGRRSFAVSGPLAPVRSASYPAPIRLVTRPGSSLTQQTWAATPGDRRARKR